MRRIVVLYVLAALLDDFWTFYFVGLRKIMFELNPLNKIVEVNPYAYLVFQALKEPLCLVVLFIVSSLFYYSFYMINRRAALLGSRLIVLSGFWPAGSLCCGTCGC